MSKKAKITLVSVFVALVAIAAVLCIIFIPKGTKGGKEFTIKVVSDRDSYSESFNCDSDLEFLGQYLRTFEGVEFSESDYGMYITGFKGMTEDMDNQYWWSVQINNTMATTGADEIPLTSGDEYELVLMQGW